MPTPLYEVHRSEATELREFHQQLVPSLYSTVEEEYRAATHGVAVIDRSWTGRIEVTGADSLDLFHRMSTNNLRNGKSGQIIGTVFTTDKGRIVDFVQVLIRDASLLLLTSPENEKAFSSWIDRYTIMEDLRLKTVTQSTAMLSLIGPQAVSLAESLTGISLQANTSYGATSSIPFNAVVSYRDEFQTNLVDIIVDIPHAADCWRLIFSRSETIQPRPMGTRAYEFFRISRGIPARGAELTEAYNPYEAGVLSAVSFNKGCYIGQEVIARLDTYQKVQKRMWGITFCDELVAAGARVIFNGEDIGAITSASPEVIRGKRIALAILKNGVLQADDSVSILSEGGTIAGVVCSFPITL